MPTGMERNPFSLSVNASEFNYSAMFDGFRNIRYKLATQESP